MKKHFMRLLSIAISACLFAGSVAFAEGGGYGNNYGNADDNLEASAISPTELIKTRLETKGVYVAEDYGTVTCNKTSATLWEDLRLTATPKNGDYKFSHWENSEGEEISKQTEITYAFTKEKPITAVFTTDLILDVDFEIDGFSSKYASIINEGDNKIISFSSNNGWDLSKLMYNGNDVHIATTFEKNTTYVMTFDYKVINGGTLPSAIIGIAPHMMYYSGDIPSLKLGTTSENLNKWLSKEIYFGTTEKEGMGESFLSNGLFQICDCTGFEVYFDNLKIKKVELQVGDKFENVSTIDTFQKVDGRIVVPLGTNVAQLKMTLRKPYLSKVVTPDGKSVQNSKPVGGNMRLMDEDKTYEIYVKGDHNSDGITVTDVVAAVDGIYNTPADDLQKTLFDTNSDGMITVTDAIKIRNVAAGRNFSSELESGYTTDKSTTSFVRSYTDYMRINARYGESLMGIYLDHAASGIRFAAMCRGDVFVNISGASANCFFTVYIDGVRVDKRFASNSEKIKIAEDLAFGYHEFEFIKQNDLDSVASLDSITLNGRIVVADNLDAPVIEFIGDSITSGVGSLYDDQGTESYRSNDLAQNSDATSTYAFMTSRALNLNWRNFSRGARGLTEYAQENSTVDNYKEWMIPLYDYTNPWRDKTDSGKYDFTLDPADIVVVNLGTNDGLIDPATPTDEYKKEMLNFIEILKAKNPNAKIVWAYGMMLTTYNDVIEETLSELGENYGVYGCKLPLDSGAEGSVTEGYENHFVSHPVRGGNTAAAEILTEFIKNNIL